MGFSKRQSAISVGITRSMERTETVGTHKVVFIEQAELTECSLVAEGCCTQAFACLTDAQHSPSLADSVGSIPFRLESKLHNVRTLSKKNMRRVEALNDRMVALLSMPQTQPVTSLTADQCNRIETERYARLQSERRAARHVAHIVAVRAGNRNGQPARTRGNQFCTALPGDRSIGGCGWDNPLTPGGTSLLATRVISTP